MQLLCNHISTDKKDQDNFLGWAAVAIVAAQRGDKRIQKVVEADEEPTQRVTAENSFDFKAKEDRGFQDSSFFSFFDFYFFSTV